MLGGTRLFGGSSARNISDGHEVAPPPGSPTSLHLPGDDPLRVLLLGDGPAVGYTVASHELALAGHLTRVLAAASGRGIALDIRSDARLSAHDALDWARQMELLRYDAIILTIGDHDAHRRTAVRSWLSSMIELLDHLGRASVPGTPVVVATIPSLDTLHPMAMSHDSGSRGHADTLNLALSAAHLPGSVTTVELRSQQGGGVEAGSERRRRWAQALVAGMGPLDALAPHLPPVATRASERRRQEALRSSRVLDVPCPPAIEDIVGSVQRLFGAPVAALNFIDDTHLWIKASRYGPTVAASRTAPVTRLNRDQGICDHTIRHSRTLVVPDAAADPRFRKVPYAGTLDGLTFYAGHPVESPEGERVGSLCLFDRRGRLFSPEDVVVLQELAFRVQNELYSIA